MRKVLLIHHSSIGCCNPLVTMLNNGNFGFPYSLLPRFPLPRFQSPHMRYGQARYLALPEWTLSHDTEIVTNVRAR